MQNDNALRTLALDRPDFSQLPVTMQVSATPLFGVLLILAGTVFPIVIFLIFTGIELVAETPAGFFWIKTVFALIPFLAVPWGWWVLKSRTTIEISENAVTRTRTTPFGTHRWSEPMTAYEGLRLDKVLPYSNAQERVPSWVVRLVHPDADRCAGLTHTQDRDLAEDVRLNLLRLTNLPDLGAS